MQRKLTRLTLACNKVYREFVMHLVQIQKDAGDFALVVAFNRERGI
jgi:hypothetical protein